MPYINRDLRSDIDRGIEDASPFIVTEGDLNYAITKLALNYIRAQGGLRYRTINEVVGVLECVKLEFYRRKAADYENLKCIENGDVYGD